MGEFDCKIDQITKLEQELFCCQECSLCREGNRGPTSYNGNPESPLMIVGEGPGGVEDEYGVPLVGPSGQLLDKALWSVNVTRNSIYTTNVIRCRPKGNRTPTFEESQKCAKLWLDREIEIVQPAVIVALGTVALHYLYKKEGRITKDRGTWFETKYKIPAIATYHPAYLLRQTGKNLVKSKWEVYYDLKAAVEKVQTVRPDFSLKSAEKTNLLALYEAQKQERCKIRKKIVDKD